MIKPTIISDTELQKITVQENHEKMVDLREKCPGIFFNIAWYIKRNGGQKAYTQAHFAREKVANLLNTAQSLLSNNYKLMLDDAYRSPAMQRKSYSNVLNKLREEHPEWKEAELELEMTNRVSKVELAPHCTGGALDLTIVDSKNTPLDMGTSLDEFTENTYTQSHAISALAKHNRKILIDVMTQAGFVNFPAEWWHWSYGDREWAFYQEKKISIYGIIEVEMLEGI